MKLKEHRIEQLSDSDMRLLAKNHRKQLIIPGSSVKKAVLEKIDAIAHTGESRILPFIIPRFTGYGIAALLAIALGAGVFIYFSSPEITHPYITLASGKTCVVRGNRESPLPAGAVIKPGYILHTKPDSVLYIQDSEQALFRIGEESSVKITKSDRSGVSIYLEHGEILVKTHHKRPSKLYRVQTGNAVIRFSSVVYIRYREGEIYMALKEGGAFLEGNTVKAYGKISLSPGESITIAVDGKFTTEPISTMTRTRFMEFERAAKFPGNLFPGKKEKSTLTITADPEEVTLLVDGEEIQHFSREISILLTPGVHTITLEQEGYESYRKEINLDTGKVMTLNAVLTGIEPEPEIKRWTTRIIYTYRDREAPDESGILGFAVSPDEIAAVTKNSLLFFTKEGKFIREQYYGASRKLFFDSVPLIYGKKLYASVNDRLIIIEPGSGKETLVDTPGMVSDGFHIGIFSGLLYFPFPDGIYLFDPQNSRLDRSARFPAGSPSSPLITGNGLYITSVVSPELLYYSHDGKTRLSYTLKAPVLCSPVETGGYVIAGDSSGVLYRLDSRLELLASASFNGGISAIVGGTGTGIYILSESGRMYLADSEDLTIKKELMIDSNPDPVIYCYKKPVLIGTDLFIGAGNGSMLIIDAATGQVREKMDIAGAAVSCSVYRANDVLFTGTEQGSIILFD